MVPLFLNSVESRMLAIGFGGPWELAIIAVIVLILFGKRLPGAAKSLGQSFSEFKKGIKQGAEDEGNSDSTDHVESKV